jgi:hypothetical protein
LGNGGWRMAFKIWREYVFIFYSVMFISYIIIIIILDCGDKARDTDSYKICLIFFPEVVVPLADANAKCVVLLNDDTARRTDFNSIMSHINIPLKHFAFKHHAFIM